MNNPLHFRTWLLLTACAVITALFFLYKSSIGQKKVSQFGEYRGYSTAVYDGTQRRSEYLALSNGTRLAYDLILPTKDGVPASERLPVLFKYTPYLRTLTIFDEDGNNIAAELFNWGWKERAMLRVRYWIYDRGDLIDPLFRTQWLETMLKNGYAVIVVERPGSGASFGVMDSAFETAAWEVDEILNWITAQEWCDGNIGMFGDSWEAQIQFAAASTGNPHLKAIFPISSSIDNYSAVVYPGGVYNKAFASFFTWSTSFLESSVLTPVDSDEDGSLLAQAREERKNFTIGEKSAEVMRAYSFRDDFTADGEQIWGDNFSLYPFVDRINQSNIPIYMTNGWYDLFTRDMFLWYANLKVPKRLIVRPLNHSEMDGKQFDVDIGVEAHRWFDYWLKGIDNGIMDEAPIHYYIMQTKGKGNWQTAEQWPVAYQELTRFYFAQGETGSVASINDGSLRSELPNGQNAQDAYNVDYSTSSGKQSRWNAINWSHNYENMRPNDTKALTYTSHPLETDVQVIGHPVVHLWLATQAADLDVFVYLEEVDSQGYSTYITEGNLRASHRALDKPAFNYLDLPYHTYHRSDLEPIAAGVPFELIFDLLPTAYRFRQASRIRITIAFADADNFETPVLEPAPEVRLLRDIYHPSFIDLPISP